MNWMNDEWRLVVGHGFSGVRGGREEWRRKENERENEKKRTKKRIFDRGGFELRLRGLKEKKTRE